MRHVRSCTLGAVPAGIALLLVLTVRAVADDPPQFVRKMSACDTSPGGGGCFNVRVDGLAVGPGGSVYIADGPNRRIQRMSAAGAFVSEWGPSFVGGTFDTVAGVAVTDGGDVLVLDEVAIWRFDSEGVFVAKYADFPPGTEAAKAIALSPEGLIYVLNRTDVLRFSATGAFLDKWTGTFGFPIAAALTVGPNTDVYVSDSYNDRILRYSATGTAKGEFGGTGTADGKLDTPWGIAATAGGDLYVADALNHRVQRFTSEGVFVSKFGAEGFTDGLFSAGPRAIALGAAGGIFVGDDGVRVQEFGAAAAPAGFALTSADLTDSPKAKKDKAVAKGTFPVAGAGFDPRPVAGSVSFGDPAGPTQVVIAAADPGWKQSKKGAWTWKSAKGTAPKVSLTVDAAKGSFSFTVSAFDFAAAPPPSSLAGVSAGGSGGSQTVTFTDRGKGRFRFRP